MFEVADVSPNLLTLSEALKELRELTQEEDMLFDNTDKLLFSADDIFDLLPLDERIKDVMNKIQAAL